MEISLQSKLLSINFNPSPLLSRPSCNGRNGPELISSAALRPHLIPYKGLSIQSPCFQPLLRSKVKSTISYNAFAEYALQCGGDSIIICLNPFAVGVFRKFSYLFNYDYYAHGICLRVTHNQEKQELVFVSTMCYTGDQNSMKSYSVDGIASIKTTCTKICAHASCCFPYQCEIGRTNGIYGVYKFQKRSRCIGVTSEMGGSMYPLSELNVISKIKGILFYAVNSVAAIFLFMLMLAAHPFILLFDRYQRKAHHLVAKLWALITIYPFFKIEVEGLENLPSPGTPAVYVSNHQSFLDIYALLTLGRSFKFISKTSIFLYPIVGWAMYLLGMIPLKRMDSRSQLDCLKRCIDLVKKGTSVFFFPEGTRCRDGKLGNFKKGAFILATKTRVPVVPITLIGTGRIMPAGEEGRLNTGSVKVIIQRPIEGNDPSVLCAEARSRIADVLAQHGCKI